MNSFKLVICVAPGFTSAGSLQEGMQYVGDLAAKTPACTGCSSSACTLLLEHQLRICCCRASEKKVLYSCAINNHQVAYQHADVNGLVAGCLAYQTLIR
jgi:hypothetical protein